jgi:hypothetical protein
VVQPSRLLRKLKREVRFRGRYSGCFQMQQILHLRAKLVGNRPPANVLQHEKDGRSRRKAVEPRLAGPLASGPLWPTARPAPFCQARYHHDCLPETLNSSDQEAQGKIIGREQLRKRRRAAEDSRFDTIYIDLITTIYCFPRRHDRDHRYHRCDARYLAHCVSALP